MDIIKALKLAKEQGKKVRPTINRELYVVYDTDKQKFVWSTSDELPSEKKYFIRYSKSCNRGCDIWRMGRSNNRSRYKDNRTEKKSN